MADRNFHPSVGSLVPKLVTLMGVLDIGAANAVASTSYFPGGSFSLNGAGDYTITLTDTYNKLCGASITVNINSATPVDLVPQVYSETVATTKLVKFKLLTAAVATAAASGTSVYVTLKLRNSGLT